MTWPRFFLLSVLLLAGIAPSPCTARTKGSGKTDTAGGLHRAVFTDRYGSIIVYLPDDLAAGDTISGTVAVEPTGRTEEQRETNSGKLSGYVIECEDQKSPAESGAFKCRVPEALAGGMMAVTLLDDKGRKVVATSVPALDVGRPSTADFQLPGVGQTGRTTQVFGPFDGDSTTTRAAIGGRNLRVLAESPRKIVAECPEDIVGSTEIEVGEGDATAKGEFRIVRVLLSAPKTSLLRGQTTEMRLEVRGLDGLEEPIELRVINDTPSIVSVEGGDAQTVTITPAEVQSSGEYTTTRTLTGASSGSFSIATDLRPPVFQPAPQPDPPPGQPAQPQPQAPRRKPGEGTLEGEGSAFTRRDTVEGLRGVEIVVQRNRQGLRDTIIQTVENYNGASLRRVIQREWKGTEWEVLSDTYSEMRTDANGQGVRTTLHVSKGKTTIARKVGRATEERWELNQKNQFVKLDRNGNPVLDKDGNPELYAGEIPVAPEWLELDLPKK